MDKKLAHCEEQHDEAVKMINDLQRQITENRNARDKQVEELQLKVSLLSNDPEARRQP